MKREEIYAAIDLERRRQSDKWAGNHEWGLGDCSSINLGDTVKVAVLTEECGEVARAVLERKWDDLADELVQVAAVAVAWLEAL